jgi:phosphoribosylaminoimidazolecarboxamide formyltransferase/IMP cyclohydrolase
MAVRIKRALISVSDKTGVVEFAAGLAGLGVELISTGGTARALRDAGLSVRDVSELTGFPEMLDGRVKTLHPGVHGGILHIRGNAAHEAAIREHGILPIDLVCVNLYPFRQTVARPDVTLEEAIENIDIGGPSMVRSAAKNYRDVVIVVDPADYPRVLDSLRREGDVSLPLRAGLMVRAFRHTAAYDAAIAAWMARNLETEGGPESFPETLTLTWDRVQLLRYGENPHQSAAFYANPLFSGISLARARQLGGKELSFNNIMDLDAALETVLEFEEPACCIVKHTNACGLAARGDAASAFAAALEGDPVSAFGGIIAVNRRVDAPCAEAITGPNTFFEAIIAPGYDADALQILQSRKKWGASLRILEVNLSSGSRDRFSFRRVAGGMLAQDADLMDLDEDRLEVVSQRAPTDAEMRDLRFAWKAVKHIKSNAIVLARDRTVVGVGAGQMNRVGSVRIAATQAGEKARGSVLASDAFFPMPDGPEEAAKAGVTAFIQPGGSVKDAEVIAVADRYGMAVVHTGIRHFKH